MCDSRSARIKQFRASLSALLANLSATTLSYVRCIKLNDTKKPFQFHPHRADGDEILGHGMMVHGDFNRLVTINGEEC